MKKYKKTLTIIIILLVALIIFASFFGVSINSKKEDGTVEKKNIIPSFKLGMEFGQTRIINMQVNQEVTKTITDAEGNVIEPEEGKEYTQEEGYTTTEVPVNDVSLKNSKTYKKAKDIIENRLKEKGTSQFSIKLDEITGELQIEIPEDSKVDEVQSFIQNSGNFILLDSQTYESVFDNTNLEKAEVMYSQGDVETGIFLQLSFNEEGTKKLNELNNIYVETTEEQTNEAGEKENVTNSKEVWVILNDSFLGSTVLPNIVHDGKIMLTFGLSNNKQELETATNEAQKQAILLNSEPLPLIYENSNETKQTNIDQRQMLIYLMAIGIVFVIAYIYLIIKFQAKGFISIYFQLGFLATLLLVLRLTNTIISVEGIAGIVICMVLEFIFTYILLTHIEEDEEKIYNKACLQFFLNTLPIYVVAIIFTFALKVNVNSFGATLFWGIILIYLYNLILPKFIFENLESGRSK